MPFAALILAAVLCGTWNLKWFPSGRAEHRASPRVEQANAEDAAENIRAGLAAFGGTGTVGRIVFLQELRDAGSASNLVTALDGTGLKVAGCSSFLERDGRLGWQQCAILSDLPVVEAGFAYWKRPRRIIAPRGYAFAVLDGGKDGLIGCFCVHLKSDYGATTEAIRAANRAKREVCTEQLAAFANGWKLRDGRRVTRVLVGGDFNVDPTAARAAPERTLANLEAAGFANGWKGVPGLVRVTHPGSRRYPGTTLDYVFQCGFGARVAFALSPDRPLSDHRMAWFTFE